MATLSDGTITIRTPTMDDVDMVTVGVLASLPELEPWMPWATPAYDREQAIGWVERRVDSTEHPFVIIDDASGQVVGSTGLNKIEQEHGIANLGYWIRSDRAGHGFATRAVPLVARYAHEQAGLHRLEIMMSVENEASRRVAEKAGARYEGLQRGRLLLHGVHHDAHMYAIVPGDLD